MPGSAHALHPLLTPALLLRNVFNVQELELAARHSQCCGTSSVMKRRLCVILILQSQVRFEAFWSCLKALWLWQVEL